MVRRLTDNLAHFESLEARQLMSGTPLGWSILCYAGGTQLRITGTTGNDAITLSLQNGSLKLGNTGGWTSSIANSFQSIWIDAGAGNDSITLDSSITTNAILYGGAGNDVIVGGSGNDRIYGGLGNNTLMGGAGDDTLISIGTDGKSTDRLYGGDGLDSFWADTATSDVVTDASTQELTKGNIHRVAGFSAGTIDKQAAGITAQKTQVKLVDPATTSKTIIYKNFADKPLFSDAGPKADDVVQGYLGDCYFLASLSSVAKSDPNSIRQSVVDLGDGTYAVQFTRNNTKLFVRVDADLPTWNGAGLAYANFGGQSSLWTAVMEKAYAFYREGTGTYASLEGGWMEDVYRDMGLKTRSFWSQSSGAGLLKLIQQELSAGRFVTFAVGSVPKGAPLIGSHAYSVDQVNVDAKGVPISLTLRNPWGIDGAGSDGKNDGYVTISGEQAIQAFLGLSSANV